MDGFIVESDNEMEQESENDLIESVPDQDEKNDNKNDNDSESNCNVNFEQFEAQSQSEQSDLNAQDNNTSGQTLHNPSQDTSQDISDDRKDAALQWSDLGHVSKIVVEKKLRQQNQNQFLFQQQFYF